MVTCLVFIIIVIIALVSERSPPMAPSSAVIDWPVSQSIPGSIRRPVPPRARRRGFPCGAAGLSRCSDEGVEWCEMLAWNWPGPRSQKQPRGRAIQAVGDGPAQLREPSRRILWFSQESWGSISWGSISLLESSYRCCRSSALPAGSGGDGRRPLRGPSGPTSQLRGCCGRRSRGCTGPLAWV